MRQYMLGVALGLFLAGCIAGTPLLAGEFGNTDSFKLERLTKAAENIVVELRGLRADLRAR